MQINKKYSILVVILLLSIHSVKAHPFYVSICQIDFNSETQSLEISVKIFADDLLLGLENAGKTKINLGEKKENPNTDEYIFDYLKANYKFKINEEQAKLMFVGKEMEKDVVWTYLEIKNITDINTMDVECNLLTEVLDSQSNIIQVNKNGVIKNLLLNKRKTSGVVTF